MPDVRSTECWLCLNVRTLYCVRLMRRTSPESQTVVETAPVDAVGKGRPTPKRRDMTNRRGPVTAPKTRKEAYARQKEAAKAVRVARSTPATQMTVQQRRAALKAGDPSVLPKRDQGQTKKLTRDYVDSRRMLSTYLLWLFPLMLVSWLIPAAGVVQIFVLVVFLALLIEWILTGRRLRAMAIARFGSADGSALSIGFYAGSRAYLPRRWRLPAPQVTRGDEI
jgi:Protein of unknown function (DUF3043)